MHILTREKEAMGILDKAVPAYLRLTSKDNDQVLMIFNKIFERSQIVDFIKQDWKRKEGNFTRFYASLNNNHKRMLLEFWGVEVEKDKYTNEMDRGRVKDRGTDSFQFNPFETEVLNRFLQFSANRTLGTVRSMKSGDQLNKYLEWSKIVDMRGKGKSWSLFYEYLLAQNVEERIEIVKEAIN
jgi:hypothetical protein